jgi:hypothetical protein
MTKCDICGNEGPLIDLRSEYQTRDIKQLCSVCEKEVNAQNSKLLEVAMNLKQSWLKRWMTNRRAA